MRAWILALIMVVGVVGCSPSGREIDSKTTTPSEALLAQYGWVTVGEPVDSSDKLPPDFRLRSGQFPWRVYLDLSKDINLDFSHLASSQITMIRFPVKDDVANRLKEISDKYLLWGVVLRDQHGNAAGAWLTYTDKQGQFAPGIPGYSLRGKSLEEVTGLTWQEYSQRHVAK